MTERQEDDLVPATAVIVHYGAPEPTLTQIEAVLCWATQVVVVANDGMASHWPESDPRVRWVIPPRNLGYGGAANVALDESDQCILVILNTDISIPSEVAKDACRALMDGRAEVMGLRMTSANGKFLSGAGSLSRFLLVGRMREPRIRIQYCDWVTGAAMFIARECLAHVRFEEYYFLGMEDTDFCVRARTQGYLTAVLNTPGVVHEGGSVIGPARWYYYATRNPIWFLRKERGLLRSLLLVSRSLGFLARVLVADFVKNRGLERSRLMGLGIWHGIVFRPSVGDPPLAWEPVEVRKQS